MLKVNNRNTSFEHVNAGWEVRRAVNAKISVCRVEAIIYLILYNTHDWTFKIILIKIFNTLEINLLVNREGVKHFFSYNPFMHNVEKWPNTLYPIKHRPKK